MAKRKPTSDESVREEVVQALKSDVRVDESGVNVDVVGGTVYLTGVIPSLFQKRTAQHVVARTRNVFDVDNELRVAPSITRDDAQIRTDVQQALERDAWVEHGRINVEVDDGIVYLNGTVEDGDAKAAAGEDARTVPSVLDVVNELAIAPHLARTDEEIATELRRDIDRNLRLKPHQVRVEVKDGVVYLEGTVNSVLQRWIAEDMARWIPGVVDVVNRLSIEGP